MLLTDDLEIVTRKNSLTADIASWPVQVQDVKDQLRILTSAEDALIAQYILEAIEAAEDYMLRSIIETQYLQTLTGFPQMDSYGVRPIYLSRPPIATIDLFTYKAVDTTTYTMVFGTDYTQSIKGRIPALFPLVNSNWPDTALFIDYGNIQIKYTCKWPNASIPSQVRRAIIMIAATKWRFRETMIAAAVNELPGIMNIYAMLDKHRRIEF